MPTITIVTTDLHMKIVYLHILTSAPSSGMEEFSINRLSSPVRKELVGLPSNPNSKIYEYIL